jgi:hypothetical protein
VRKGHDWKRSAVTSLALIVLLSGIASVPILQHMYVVATYTLFGVTLQLERATFILEVAGKRSRYMTILIVLLKI